MYGTSLFYNLYASNSQTDAYSRGGKGHMVVPLFFARKKYEINTHLIYYLCKIFLPDPLNLIQLSYMFHYFLVLYILYRNTTFVKWISSLLLQIFEMKKWRKLLLKTLLWRYDFSKLSCPREGDPFSCTPYTSRSRGPTGTEHSASSKKY